jgi:predicted transglutaminase-like cysteine proteinase
MNLSLKSSNDTMSVIITIFLLVYMAATHGEPNAFAGADARAASVVIVTTDDPAQDQTEVQAPESSQAKIRMAALGPSEPSVKSPVLPESAIRPPALTEPFGLDAIPVMTGEILAKWSGVGADIRTESEILARCNESAALCPSAARSYLGIIAEGRSHTGRARVGVINRAINLSIRPLSDMKQWGTKDRWTAPLATLATGRGDCEDYALAKYFALLEAGVSAQDLRLVILRDLAFGDDHAVVAARIDGVWTILDNRRLALVDDRDMRRIIPLFVLDRDGVKQFVPKTMPDVPRVAEPQTDGRTG